MLKKYKVERKRKRKKIDEKNNIEYIVQHHNVTLQKAILKSYGK